MIYILMGAVLLAIFLFAGQSFVKANPADMARKIKTWGGLGLLTFAGVMAVTGRVALAIPAAAFGLSLLGWGGIGRLGRFGGGASRPSGGQRSRVRSAMFEMTLDHDTGSMTGQVLAGKFQGQSLERLPDADLKAVWQETGADAESRALFEAYLDRRSATWREDFQADAAGRQSGPAGTGAMTDEEAYQILGLSAGASEAEIRSAHRRLMKRLHPDHGGTTFLAAKLNEAKDWLLRRH